MSKVDLFIKKYLPYAQRMEEEFKVPALVAMSQSALETGWGDKAPGNMMFGMKTGKSWTGKRQLITTTEYHDNENFKYPEVISITKVSANRYKYRVKDYFRAYDSPLGSFRDYARLLARNKRYQKAFNYTSDPVLFAKEIARAGYATAPNYFEILRKIINIIKKKVGSE